MDDVTRGRVRDYPDADDLIDVDDAPEYPLATLWLPDPESRTGWAMKHVWRRETPPRPDERPRPPLGFR